jgi:hypothetical protein
MGAGGPERTGLGILVAARVPARKGGRLEGPGDGAEAVTSGADAAGACRIGMTSARASVPRGADTSAGADCAKGVINAEGGKEGKKA